MLSELGCGKQKRNLYSTLGWLSVHLIVWFICLLCIGVCMVAVYYLPPYIEKVQLLVRVIVSNIQQGGKQET